MISNVVKQNTSLVKLAHSLIKGKIKAGAIVIDATVGNGYDTLFLLEQIKPDGLVYGFDIQQTAIDSAKKNLETLLFADCLTLTHADHAQLTEHIPTAHYGKISAIMFNLGYLPGGDKSITTQVNSTLSALTQASRLLTVGGMLTILAYPGHLTGKLETEQVNQWCFELNPQEFEATLIENSTDNPSAPKLFVVNKLA